MGTLIAISLGISPFIFMGLAASVIIGGRFGWRAALRVALLIVFPMLAAVALLVYGFLLLPDEIVDLVENVFVITLGGAACYRILVYAIGMARGQRLWADSKPPGFIDIRGVRFNALFLLFGAFIVFSYKRDIVHILAPSQRGVELQDFTAVFLAALYGLQAFRRFQIRQNGILTVGRGLLRWSDILAYEWVQYRDQVELEMRHWLWGKRTLTLDVPPEMRPVLEKYLAAQVQVSVQGG